MIYKYEEKEKLRYFWYKDTWVPEYLMDFLVTFYYDTKTYT